MGEPTFGRCWQAIAAPFDGPLPDGNDLDGERFGADTDFEIERYHQLPVKWHHDRDPLALIRGALGTATNWRSTPKGLVSDVDLDLDNPYVKLIAELGVPLYVSTSIRPNSKPRMTADGRILSWPLGPSNGKAGELSITTSPQNGYAVLVPRTPAEQLRDTLGYVSDMLGTVQRHMAQRRAA